MTVLPAVSAFSLRMEFTVAVCREFQIHELGEGAYYIELKTTFLEVRCHFHSMICWGALESHTPQYISVSSSL